MQATHLSLSWYDIIKWSWPSKYRLHSALAFSLSAAVFLPFFLGILILIAVSYGAGKSNR